MNHAKVSVAGVRADIFTTEQDLNCSKDSISTDAYLKWSVTNLARNLAVAHAPLWLVIFDWHWFQIVPN